MSISKKTKITFCPGPGALIPEWINSQKEYFGRGDKEYSRIKQETINWLKKISKKNEIIPIAGSGTTAGLLAFNTFLKRKILLINTGYYSERWINYLKKRKIKNLNIIDYKDIDKVRGKFDWIVFVYVETATCTKFDIKKIYRIKKKIGIQIIVRCNSVHSIGKKSRISRRTFF